MKIESETRRETNAHLNKKIQKRTNQEVRVL